MYELSRYMGASVRVLEMQYAHLVRDAEETARAKLDAAAAATFRRLVGVRAVAAGVATNEETPHLRDFLVMERAGIEPANLRLAKQAEPVVVCRGLLRNPLGMRSARDVAVARSRGQSPCLVSRPSRWCGPLATAAGTSQESSGTSTGARAGVPTTPRGR